MSLMLIPKKLARIEMFLIVRMMLRECIDCVSRIYFSLDTFKGY